MSTLTAAAVYDAFYRGSGDAAADFLTFVAPKKGVVVDVGCGTGRLIKPLIERGFKYVGIEPDEPRYQQALACAKEHGVVVKPGGFHDLGDVIAEGMADVVAAINDPFAYLLTGAARKIALRRSFEALKPGGVLVLDQPSFLWILKHYRAPQPMTATVGEWRVERTPKHVIDYDAGTWTHVDEIHAQSLSSLRGAGGEKHARFEHVMAMAGYPEVRERLVDAGFYTIETYRSLEGREPAPVEGPRYVVVARKPG